MKFAANWGERWLQRLRERPDKTRNDRQAIRYYTNLFRATPAWLSEMDKARIRRIYRDAHARGLHVDHIVPLSSRLVCGLHVPWNLRAREPAANNAKSNKYWPGCPYEQTEITFKPRQLELDL